MTLMEGAPPQQVDAVPLQLDALRRDQALEGNFLLQPVDIAVRDAAIG